MTLDIEEPCHVPDVIVPTVVIFVDPFHDDIAVFSTLFKLRRVFNIKKKTKVLIVEDVITTGKSSLECVRLIKKFGGKFVGIACLIDRSKKIKMSKKIISQVKLDIPVYKRNKLPTSLRNIQITKPGSRYLR